MSAYRYYTATTLDGFLADPDDNLDWLLSQPIDETGPMSYGEFIGDVGAVVMGATTYEWVCRNALEDAAWPYAQPSFVLSHRDLVPVAENVSIVAGPVADLRSRLEAAAGGKDVWIVGGGDLATQCAQAGMLDEVVVSIAPVMLGAGRPLFTGRLDLELRNVARNQAFVCARYAVRSAGGTA